MSTAPKQETRRTRSKLVAAPISNNLPGNGATLVRASAPAEIKNAVKVSPKSPTVSLTPAAAIIVELL